MRSIIYRFVIVIWTATCAFYTQASSDSKIDEFLLASSAPPYDCPKSEFIPQIETYLASDTVNPEQRLRLQTLWTHDRICHGDHAPAIHLLDDILLRANVDKQAYYYAMAIYQRGFIYDVQENPKRCEYYKQAFEISKGIHPDIYLSATLGHTTVCGGLSDAEKLGLLYPLVEQLTKDGDPKALAHLHSNIGLLYGQLGQHSLAAEQYLKGHELASEYYEGSNKLSILVSAISSLMASGSFDEAEAALNQYRIINKDVATPLTNFQEVFLEAGYFYRTNNLDELVISVAHWNENVKNTINQPLYNDLFKWYETVDCVRLKNISCIRDYLDYEKQSQSNFRSYTRRNKDYLKFKVDLYFTLEEYQLAEQAVNALNKSLTDGLWQSQKAGKVLGMANLHSKIVELESEVEEAEAAQKTNLYIFIAVVLITVVGFVRALRKRNLLRLEIDPTTEMFNSRAALKRISELDSPSNGKANALAIFDVGNFKELNQHVGAGQSDVVLKEIAQIFKSKTRESDILGRFAPEQFIICLKNVEEEIAKSFFDRIHKAVESTSIGINHGKELNIRSSMSIFISHEKFDDLNEVLDEMLLSISVKR
jgi:diguanylate cyclase (GGDEF)-like protein